MCVRVHENFLDDQVSYVRKSGRLRHLQFRTARIWPRGVSRQWALRTTCTRTIQGEHRRGATVAQDGFPRYPSAAVCSSPRSSDLLFRSLNPSKLDIADRSPGPVACSLGACTRRIRRAPPHAARNSKALLCDSVFNGVSQSGLPEERELRINAFARSLSCLVQYRSRTDAIYRHRHTTCYNHEAVKCAGKHPTEDDLELYSLTRIPAGPVLDAIEEHLSVCESCRSTVEFNIRFITTIKFVLQVMRHELN